MLPDSAPEIFPSATTLSKKSLRSLSYPPMAHWLQSSGRRAEVREDNVEPAIERKRSSVAPFEWRLTSILFARRVAAVSMRRTTR